MRYQDQWRSQQSWSSGSLRVPNAEGVSSQQNPMRVPNAQGMEVQVAGQQIIPSTPNMRVTTAPAVAQNSSSPYAETAILRLLALALRSQR